MDTLQNLDDRGDPDLLIGSLGSTQSHLHISRTVKSFRRILADVTVAAVVVCLFTEIVQEDPSPTDARFCILLHPSELLYVHILLSALFGKLRQLDDIRQGIEEHGVCWGTVSACTPDLLIETLDALGHIIMDHPSHITLIDTHAKGDGGTDHQQLVVLKLLLCPTALRWVHARMIGSCVDALLSQVLSHLLRGLSAQTVDDPRIHRSCLDEVQNEVHLLSVFITSFYRET